MNEDTELSKMLAVTAELTGTDLSAAAAEIMARELATYFDRAQVLRALGKCRRELKGRLTMVAIIERLDDGRPGPEEAWAMMPRDEAQSVIWSAEMAEAFGVAGPLLEAGDRVGARMAFKEAYAKLVSKARDERRPVRWTPSLGHDRHGRDAALAAAVSAERITRNWALELGYCADNESQDMMTLAPLVQQMVGHTKRTEA